MSVDACLWIVRLGGKPNDEWQGVGGPEPVVRVAGGIEVYVCPYGVRGGRAVCECGDVATNETCDLRGCA